MLFPGPKLYLAVAAIAAVDAVWLAVSHVSLVMSELLMVTATIVASVLVALILAHFARRPGLHQAKLIRLSCFFQGMFFLQTAWVVLRVFNHLSMTTELPYADDLLARWDEALRFDWRGYFALAQGHRAMLITLSLAYMSLSLVSFIAFFALNTMGDERRIRFFLETFFVTAIICTVIGAFFPAKAAVATYFGDVGKIASFREVPGVYHLEHLFRLRGDQPVTLNLDDMPGLVTFPSFHTAAGIVLIASFWRTYLFPAIFAYSLLMIASTPIFGAHYFVDLIGGTVVAMLVVTYSAAQRDYAGLLWGGITRDEPSLTPNAKAPTTV